MLSRAGRSSLLLAAIAAVYATSLSNGFTFDDPSVIQEAGGFLAHPNLSAFFSTEYFQRSGESTYRPIVTLSYVLDWHIGGGAAWAFHLQSLFWHLVAVGAMLILLA